MYNLYKIFNLLNVISYFKKKRLKIILYICIIIITNVINTLKNGVQQMNEHLPEKINAESIDKSIYCSKKNKESAKINILKSVSYYDFSAQISEESRNELLI